MVWVVHRFTIYLLPSQYVKASGKTKLLIDVSNLEVGFLETIIKTQADNVHGFASFWGDSYMLVRTVLSDYSIIRDEMYKESYRTTLLAAPSLAKHPDEGVAGLTRDAPPGTLRQAQGRLRLEHIL
jgi:hypothetical protein